MKRIEFSPSDSKIQHSTALQLQKIQENVSSLENIYSITFLYFFSLYLLPTIIQERVIRNQHHSFSLTGSRASPSKCRTESRGKQVVFKLGTHEPSQQEERLCFQRPFGLGCIHRMATKLSIIYCSWKPVYLPLLLKDWRALPCKHWIGRRPYQYKLHQQAWLPWTAVDIVSLCYMNGKALTYEVLVDICCTLVDAHLLE